jgi:pimeloyl-ACP methyl ester carboxylesterase
VNATDKQTGVKPTIVLVHGAFADASSWNGVMERLQQQGYTVIALANPLRGLAADSAYAASLLNQIDGPVLLAAHSYGGAVITNAATSAPNVAGLVYIAAFATDDGENLNDVESGSKDSILGTALVQYHYPSGPDGETSVELAINPALFREAFAADLPAETVALMAATQRPTPRRRSARRPGRRPGRCCRPGRWSAPATRPPAPTSSGLRLSGRAPTSLRSRART